MASIVREVAIGAPAERCWTALRVFDPLPERLAPGFITSLEMVGEGDRAGTSAADLPAAASVELA
jgi:hypothetical protein